MFITNNKWDILVQTRKARPKVVMLGADLVGTIKNHSKLVEWTLPPPHSSPFSPPHKLPLSSYKTLHSSSKVIRDELKFLAKFMRRGLILTVRQVQSYSNKQIYIQGSPLVYKKWGVNRRQLKQRVILMCLMWLEISVLTGGIIVVWTGKLWGPAGHSVRLSIIQFWQDQGCQSLNIRGKVNSHLLNIAFGRLDKNQTTWLSFRWSIWYKYLVGPNHWY